MKYFRKLKTTMLLAASMGTAGLYTLKATAQIIQGNYVVKHYAVDEGSPALDHLKFLDRSGKLWIKNSQGIFTFDGLRFQNYTLTDGLPKEDIEDIKEDPAGKIYAASASGIYQYAPSNAKPFRLLHRSPLSPEDQLSVARVSIFPSNGQGIFYFTYHVSKGTLIYRMQPGKTSLFLKLPPSIPSVIIKDSLMYVGTKDDLLVVDICNGKVVSKFPFASKSKKFISWGHDLWCYTGRLYRVTSSGITDSLPVNEHVRYLDIAFTGPKSYIAVETDNPSLVTYDGHSLRQTLLDAFPELANLQEAELMPGRQGSFWLLFANDLYRFKTKLPYYRPSSVQAFINTMNEEGGSYRIDSIFLRRKEVNDAIKQMKNSEALRAVFEDHNAIFYCTAAGIYWQETGRKLQLYVPDYVGKISRGEVTTAFKDGDVRWFYGPNQLAFMKNGIFTNIPDLEDSDVWIWEALGDRHHNIWITRLNALAVYDSALHAIRKGLPADQSFINVARDRSGDIWISGDKHHIYKVRRDGTDGVTLADSLASPGPGRQETVSDMIFDDYGNLWVLYPEKMIIFRNGPGGLRSDRYQCLTREDGLAPLLKARCEIFKTADGKIGIASEPQYIMDTDGILDRYNNKPPHIYLTDVQIHYKPFDWARNGFRTGSHGLPLNPEMSHNQNTLTFFFSAIVLHNQPYCRYQYRLAPLQNGWQDATITDLKAAYPGLQPGHYRFELRAANENGIWSQPVAYTFSILAPWYDRWWARSLWVLMAAGVIYALFTIRKRAALQKMRMEQMMTEQKLVALRAQINPHALQNTFNFLALKVHYEQYKDSLIDAIHKVSRYFRSVLDKSDHTIITLEEEMDFSEDYLTMQQALLEDRFSYTFDVDDNIDTQMIKVPSMLLQPILENAIRYSTEKENKGDIRISASEQDDQYIILEVRDNGPGKPKQEGQQPKMSFGRLHQSKGLKITQDKLILSYQKCRLHPSIELQPNAGTPGHTVRIRIPLQ